MRALPILLLALIAGTLYTAGPPVPTALKIAAAASGIAILAVTGLLATGRIAVKHATRTVTALTGVWIALLAIQLL